jgi:hypothetical protein
MFTAAGPILPAPVSGGSGSGLMTVMEAARGTGRAATDAGAGA